MRPVREGSGELVAQRVYLLSAAGPLWPLGPLVSLARRSKSRSTGRISQSGAEVPVHAFPEKFPGRVSMTW